MREKEKERKLFRYVQEFLIDMSVSFSFFIIIYQSMNDISLIHSLLQLHFMYAYKLRKKQKSILKKDNIEHKCRNTEHELVK